MSTEARAGRRTPIFNNTHMFPSQPFLSRTVHAPTARRRGTQNVIDWRDLKGNFHWSDARSTMVIPVLGVYLGRACIKLRQV